MQYCQDKDINRFIAKLIKSGGSFERGRHSKLRHPAGTGFLTIPKTPSDRRTLQNIRRDLRYLERRVRVELWAY